MVPPHPPRSQTWGQYDHEGSDGAQDDYENELAEEGMRDSDDTWDHNQIQYFVHDPPQSEASSATEQIQLKAGRRGPARACREKRQPSTINPDCKGIDCRCFPPCLAGISAILSADDDMLEDDPDYPGAARTRLRGSDPDSDLFCGVEAGSEEEDSNYTDDSEAQSCASEAPGGGSDAGSWCESVYSSDSDGEDPEDYRPRQRAARCTEDMEDAGYGGEREEENEDRAAGERQGGRSLGDISMREYYRYLIHHRHPTRAPFSPLHYGRMGWQQYLTHMGIKLEDERLNFLASEKGQKKIRSETYLTLRDHVFNKAQSKGMTCGKRVILPASHPGSQRYIKKKYHDAMSMCMATGAPDLFITITANPNWTEISENLHPGQKWHDRNELVHRVFRLKLKAMLNEIIDQRLFGEVIGFAMTIEYQV